MGRDGYEGLFSVTEAEGTRIKGRGYSSPSPPPKNKGYKEHRGEGGIWRNKCKGYKGYRSMSTLEEAFMELGKEAESEEDAEEALSSCFYLEF